MNNEKLEAGLASDLNRELEALREERDVFFDAHHNSSLLIKKLEEENEQLKSDNEKLARAWKKAADDVLNAEYSACVKADLHVEDLHEMLQLLADDEITIAKAKELIRAWVAGNYDKNCLPSV